MAKILGPTANLGLGFWAQQPIVLGPAEVTAEFQPRAPHFSPPRDFPPPGPTWIQRIHVSLIPIPQPPGERVYDLPAKDYPPPGQTWIGLNLNLFTPPDLTDKLFRVPHFTPPRAHPPPGQTWTQWFNLSLVQPVAALPPGIQESDLSPRAYLEPATRTWTAYNLSLLTQDRFPVGQEIYDRPPYGPAQPLRVWTSSYNLNLIGQDQFPAGEQYYDLTPEAYPEPATRTWVWQYNLNLVSQDRMLVGEQLYDRSPLGPIQPLRSWEWTYNLNLIGKDQLPTGEQRYDLTQWTPNFAVNLRTWVGLVPPAAVVAGPFNQTDWQLPRAPALPQRSWTWNYSFNLIGQDRLPAGEQVYDAPVGPIQPLRVWQWSYNLSLIGQDALPVGEQRFDLTPFGYIHPTQLRTWINFVHLALFTPPAPRPFSQVDWPLPRAPLQPAFSYVWNYNLNLIGQDRLPTGEQVFELTPRDYSRPHIYLWDWRYNFNLIGKDALPIGEQKTELAPAGHIHPTQLRTWIDYRNRAIDFVAGAQPDGKRWFDLAPRDDRPYQLRSWTWAYNLNLIGKDQLPVGNRISDLPPRITPAAVQTWISQVNLALSRPAVPFSQTDWQNPRWPQQAVINRTWTASFNLNLIGQDRLPTGEAVFDLAPRGHVYPTDLRTFIRQLNLALIVPPAPLPKNQKDWPLPGQPLYPTSNRSFINFSNIAFIVPPPPEIPPRDPTHIRTRGGFENEARGAASLDRRGAGMDNRGPTSPLNRRGSGPSSRGRNQS
jgi:hypothetical protein